MIERAYRLKGAVFVGVLICLVVTADSGSVSAQDAPTPKTSLDAQQLFTKASPAVVKIHTYDAGGRLLGQGSGFFVSADGMLVTNYHVVKKAVSAKIVFPSGKRVAVLGMLASMPKADVALLKVDTKAQRFLKIAAKRPDVGTKVWAIGSPKGLDNSLSEGLVSGYRDIPGVAGMLQTTAPISPGSSGGPLLAATGEVVGVTTLTRIGGQNLNFAVPCKYLRAIVILAGKPAKLPGDLSRNDGPTTRPASDKFISFSEILCKVPNSILPTADPRNPLKAGGPHKWTKMRIHAFNAWAKEHLHGATLSLEIKPKTKLESQPSRSPPGGLLIYLYHWKDSDVGVRYVYAFTMALNEKSLMNLASLSDGKSVAVVGQIRYFHVRLTKFNRTDVVDFSDKYLHIAVEFDTCRIDLAPPQKPTIRPRRKPTSRPAPRKRTNEDKARSQLALAKSYIGARLIAKAQQVLKELIGKYPKTRAAVEAQIELEKLGKR